MRESKIDNMKKAIFSVTEGLLFLCAKILMEFSIHKTKQRRIALRRKGVCDKKLIF